MEKRFYKKYISVDWGDDSKIIETIVVDDNKNNNEDDFYKKNRQ